MGRRGAELGGRPTLAETGTHDTGTARRVSVCSGHLAATLRGPSSDFFGGRFVGIAVVTGCLLWCLAIDY